MSILLLILAGVVIYYLYITLQDYLRNPTKLNTPTASEPSPYPQNYQQNQNYPQDPYTAQDPAQKLQNSYEGASIALLSYVLQAGISQQAESKGALDSATADTPSAPFTPLQLGLVEEFIHALCAHATKPSYEQNLRDLLAYYAPAYPSPDHASAPSRRQQPALDFSTLEPLSIASLAEIFLDNTYGEYKKRLQFVGLLLMLAWSDKELNEKEQDIILDIAAFLEIDNADFNELYESFEALESTPLESTSSLSSLKQLLDEQRDQVGLQQAYFSYVQKLCASARKRDKPQAQSMPALWESEQIYTTILRTLLQSDRQKSTQGKRGSKGGAKVESKAESKREPKTSSALDSPASSALESASLDSSTNAAPESSQESSAESKNPAQNSQAESKAKPQADSKVDSKADSAPNPKRDSSWDHI